MYTLDLFWVVVVVVVTTTTTTRTRTMMMMMMILMTMIDHDDDAHLYSAVTPCSRGMLGALGRVVSFEVCC